jgi:hypothetical protein
MNHHRVIVKIALNEESQDVILQFRGNSSAVQAKALEFKTDEEGNITYLLLDRLIHKANESMFECFLNEKWEQGFSLSGCYVSELNRSVANR